MCSAKHLKLDTRHTHELLETARSFPDLAVLLSRRTGSIQDSRQSSRESSRSTAAVNKHRIVHQQQGLAVCEGRTGSSLPFWRTCTSQLVLGSAPSLPFLRKLVIPCYMAIDTSLPDHKLPNTQNLNSVHIMKHTMQLIGNSYSCMHGVTCTPPVQQ